MDGNALIGTTAPAPRQADMLMESWQSHDYANNNPYPQHAFGPQQWPADKGPRPTPLPYAQILIAEGAEFVFRNGEPTFSVPDDPEADAFLQEVIAQNDLGSEWIPLAIAAAHQGAIAAKFNFDAEDEECPVRISFLDVPQECRVWMDPHDRRRVLMARIQYPYRDPETNEWCHYREEWTADRYVKYLPKRTGDSTTADPRFLPGYRADLGDGGGWEVDPEHDQRNPFGLVPVTVLRNRKVKGNPLGEGDLWRLWRIVDRVAVTMHGEDRANQLHSEPATAFLNARPENEGPLLPGEALVLMNDGEAGGPPADVKLLEPTGAAREYSHRSIEKWEDLLYRAAGLSRVNPAEVTNKGNMTALAFAMTFGRTISTSDRKRKLWGDSGLCVFFRNLLIALSRVGGIKALSSLTESIKVACAWPKYFEATDEDVQTITDRTLQQKDGGVLDLERAARRIATAEKMPPAEIEQLVADLRARAEAAAEADEDDAAAADPGPAGDDPAELVDVMDSTGANNFTA